MKQYSLSLHIFRRDLRLQDNTALLAALQSSKQVLPCFIFDKRQIEDNPYKSSTAISFMVRSLLELDEALKKHGGRLFVFYGKAEEVVDELLQLLPINAVYMNRDYTPFSRTRDAAIEKSCQKKGIDYSCFADLLLTEPEEVKKPDGKPYTIFTHFYNKALSIAVAAPKVNSHRHYYAESVSLECQDKFKQLQKEYLGNITQKGGRQEALNLLQRIERLRNYNEARNFPAQAATSQLSAHNKFGTISIREFYQAIQNQLGPSDLTKELYWRDFFTHIAFHFPHVFSQAFNPKYASIRWPNNKEYFAAWCEGRTGFPIVDAGMRELNATGFMHNRVRMVVASFLVKNLHVDWCWGEKYFAQKLVDYDVAINNGNWQWAASTGCDAQPYFRIFNPWLQQMKYDAQCDYIKQYIPELNSLMPKEIHHWSEIPKTLPDYPKPIVNHAITSKTAKQFYSNS